MPSTTFDLDEMVGSMLDDVPASAQAPASTVKSSPKEKQQTQQSAPTSQRRRAPCPAATLFFDLETIPDYSREELFGLDPIPEPSAYAGENDGPAPSELIRGTEDEVKAAIAKAQSGGKLLPRKILEAALVAETASKKPRKGVMSLFDGMMRSIDGEESRIEAAKDARRKTMSVTPEMCRVVSMAWAMGDEAVQCAAFGMKGAAKDRDEFERDVLTQFWTLAKRAKVIVGFNHVGFDLPVIYTRSILLGVEPSRMIDLKPWGGEVVDVMAARWPKSGSKTLKLYSQLMGLDIPAGDIDGSQVEGLAETDPAKLAEYNRSDVQITRELYLMGRGLFWI